MRTVIHRQAVIRDVHADASICSLALLGLKRADDLPRAETADLIVDDLVDLQATALSPRSRAFAG